MTLSPLEFFSRAQERLTFDVPAGFADPSVIPRHDQQDADPSVVVAIAAVRPIRLAAVLVPIIERDEPSVLFTQRTAHLTDHAGQISFPGGKIDANDESPAAAALREAEEEVALSRRFVDPIGYLDVHLTPFGHRVMGAASCRQISEKSPSGKRIFAIPVARASRPKTSGRSTKCATLSTN